MKKIAIIGGGAAGMAASIEAAKNSENYIVLFERQPRVGKKLLATGNGRCNLTNTGAAVENYHGASPGFVLPALKSVPPAAVLAFFRELGLVTNEEYGGRVYPLSNSANSVVDVLRFGLNRENIQLRPGEPVTDICQNSGGFLITAAEKAEKFDAVIVACGGCAGERLGGVKDGYELLKALGHSRTGLHPSLVQLTTEQTYPRALKGVRCDAALRLSGAAQGESRGEIQFTEKGVSGPAAFDISRAVSLSGDGKKTLHIDLLPRLSEGELSALLLARQKNFPTLPAEELLTGILHNRLGKMVIKYAGLSPLTPLFSLTDRDFGAVAAACRDFALPVKGTEGFSSAQVTAGGIRTEEFEPRTMESRLVKNLYACGEVLDIDGDCGGYNLQWAFSSGIIAGRLGK